MRVLVTGATGFVGRWLVRDLAAEGHEPIAAPPSAQLDITDGDAVLRFIGFTRPDAIVHLAGTSFVRDAARDPEHAFRINEGGTRTLLEAVRRQRGVPVLVAGSSEAYGRPEPGDLPLAEAAPLRAAHAYGLSKMAQERAALELAAVHDLPVLVTRSFNLIGPGQRPEFVAPALARRVLDARTSGESEIVVGNLDVRRDFGDVRDAARAYRLLIEALGDGAVPSGTVVNIATGRSTSVRAILETLCRIVGVTVRPRVDPSLVRENDAPEIVGDFSRLRGITGWSPSIPLERTLADLVVAVDRPASSAAGVR